MSDAAPRKAGSVATVGDGGRRRVSGGGLAPLMRDCRPPTAECAELLLIVKSRFSGSPGPGGSAATIYIGCHCRSIGAHNNYPRGPRTTPYFQDTF